MKKKLLYFIIIIISGLLGAGLDIAIRPTDTGIKIDASYNIEFSDVQLPAEMVNDQGEIITDENIPTIEEVDGGLFMDDLEPEKGDKGWTETYNVTSPEAFKLI